jgi:hypothetical protein
MKMEVGFPNTIWKSGPVFMRLVKPYAYGKALARLQYKNLARFLCIW